MTTNEQQSKLLKAAGYDVPCREYYHNGVFCQHRNNAYNYNGRAMVGECASAPTLNDVCDWLRDVKGYHVSATFDGCYGTNGSRVWFGAITVINSGASSYPVILSNSKGSYIHFPAHDLAQSAAIDKCLQILNEGK